MTKRPIEMARKPHFFTSPLTGEVGALRRVGVKQTFNCHPTPDRSMHPDLIRVVRPSPSRGGCFEAIS